jgi:hypothetical protein
VRQRHADDFAVGLLVGGHGHALRDDAVVAFQRQLHEARGMEDLLPIAFALFDGSALIAHLGAVEIDGVPLVEDDLRGRRRLLASLHRRHQQQNRAAPHKRAFHPVSLA